MNPLITGRNLSKSYGSKLALNNVNFEIEQGAPAVSYTHLTLPTNREV